MSDSVNVDEIGMEKKDMEAVDKEDAGMEEGGEKEPSKEDSSEGESSSEDSDDGEDGSIRFFFLHQVPLVAMRKKFGEIPVEDVAKKIMGEINISMEPKFVLQSKVFQTKTGQTVFDCEGIKPLYYARMTKVLDPLLAQYNVPRYNDREQRIIFHYHAKFLFVLTFKSTFPFLQDFSCKQFPAFVRDLAGIKSKCKGWKTICAASCLYNLKAFKNYHKRNVKVKIGEGFIGFEVDEKDFDMYGFPHMWNYLIKVCQLRNRV